MSDTPHHIEQLSALIAGYSQKAEAAFRQSADAVLAHLDEPTARKWVELGCFLARASGATAIRYFRESPGIFNAIQDQACLGDILDMGLQLARQDYGIALEFFRQSPDILNQSGREGLRQLAGAGATLAEQDYPTAVEFLKTGPGILGLVDSSHLSLWGQTGLCLAREDRERRDFLSLEFFRVSPELLGLISSRELRHQVLEITHQMSQGSPRLSMEFFKQCPGIFGAMDSPAMQEQVLLRIRDLAGSTPEVVPAFIGHSVEAAALAEGSASRFEHWAREGLRIARKNPEQAIAYFSLRLKSSRDAFTASGHAVFLKDLSQMLRFYAEALCGQPVEIRGVPAGSGIPTTPEGVITLPEKINLFENPKDNFRFYKVMTFHEAGHLEFKSFDPLTSRLLKALLHPAGPPPGQPVPALIESLAPLLHGEEVSLSVPQVLGRFPDPILARNLWTIVEEGRIDFLLRHAYQGIREDLDFVISRQIRGRSNLAELPPRQAILEALLQLSITDTTEVPIRIAEAVSGAYEVLKAVHQPGTTVQDSFRTVFALYQFIHHALEQYLSEEQGPENQEPPSEIASEEAEQALQPLENFAYRSPLDLQGETPPSHSERHHDQPPPPDLAESAVTETPAGETALRQDSGSPRAQTAGAHTASENTFLYDEWDPGAGDYRLRWCRVEEKILPPASSENADRIGREQAPLIRQLRRHFEHLRPRDLQKIRRQEHGEEINLEAAIESLTEQRAGLSPSGRVYDLRLKNKRDVCAAFLIDLSGSTRQQLPAGPGRARRTIDVEMESLLLLGEAVHALGDQFGIFGFSGNSRNQVNFYRIKDFDEPYTGQVRQKIGAISPEGQNRDGAAIRHVTAKLAGRPEKVRLFILLSDGKPLDEDYRGTYAMEDTRMALQEARARGVHAFCITVDPGASEYIRAMYNAVSYTIIQDVSALPQKLPRIYKHLTT